MTAAGYQKQFRRYCRTLKSRFHGNNVYSFVPNYGMGLQDMGYIIKNATIFCDVHMIAEEPGRYIKKFAGQKWLPFVDAKIEKLAAARSQYGYQVVIDGNCSPRNIARAHAEGAIGFVLGIAGLFGHGDYRTTVAQPRSIASQPVREPALV